MLWHYLANGSNGSRIRELLAEGDWRREDLDKNHVYVVPSSLANNREIQRQRFHKFAGPWMGTDRRRGFPYTWIPNHLGDSEGTVSPRSFIKALQTAALDTDERHPDHGYALHYDSIKRGVQEASQIRVRELREDYPWVDRLIRPYLEWLSLADSMTLKTLGKMPTS